MLWSEPVLQNQTIKMVVLSIALAIFSGCSSSDSDSPSDIESLFAKKTTVLGIRVFATDSVSDAAIQHTASLLAEYLDSDNDGIPNNSEVVSELADNAAMVIFASETDEESFFNTQGGEPDIAFTAVREDELVSPNGLNGDFDAGLEEVLHLVTQLGYSKIYSDLAEERGSDLANAMDTARGGYFETVPSSYPNGAWYTYTDQTCEYDCMITEYIYWGLTSFLGGQDFSGREADISDEWQLNTAAKIQATDNALYAILTNNLYAWPTVLPDGNYQNNRVFDIVSLD